MKDWAVRQCDGIEKDLLKRIRSVYKKAWKACGEDLLKLAKLIAKMQELEAELPKDWTEEQREHWRMGFYAQRSRYETIAKGLADTLNGAGEESAILIQGTMPDYYMINREYTIDSIQSKLDFKASFGHYDRNNIKAILDKKQPPFSRIAYQNLGQDKRLVRKLQDEMMQATILGEGKRELSRRLNRIVNYKYSYQAQRLAQTERTRIQSQARYDTGQEAVDMGIQLTKEWSASGINTRETHRHLDGQILPFEEDFKLIDGDRLKYPGDPSGQAKNIINCYCVLITDVREEARMPKRAEIAK